MGSLILTNSSYSLFNAARDHRTKIVVGADDNYGERPKHLLICALTLVILVLLVDLTFIDLWIAIWIVIIRYQYRRADYFKAGVY